VLARPAHANHLSVGLRAGGRHSEILREEGADYCWRSAAPAVGKVPLSPKYAGRKQGVGLLASPWALDFTAQSNPISNAVIVGVLVAVLALWAMLSEPTIRERLFHRHQPR